MINLSPELKNVQTLYGAFIKDNLIVNRRYQRKLIWSLEEKQKLIESILNGFPIPNILLATKKESQSREGEEIREIIDGMQRLHTIMSFIQQDFAYNGQYFNIECFPTAKNHIKNKGLELKSQLKSSSYSYLSDEQCGKILDYSLSTLVMRDVTDEIVDEVFSRINTYGRRLSDQERRQAGVQTRFANLVRRISVQIRGDRFYDDHMSLSNYNENIIPLSKMPEISIDSVRNKLGYGIHAENTFWVKHKILYAQDLKDSADEEYFADIIACIVSNKTLVREGRSLDKLYMNDNDNDNIDNSLLLYNEDKIYAEILFCFKEIEKLCGINKKVFRDVIDISGTNPIPAVFSNIFLAIHHLFFKDRKYISDYKLLCNKLNGIYKKLGRNKTTENRKDNIAIIKTCIEDAFSGELDMRKVFESVKMDEMEIRVEKLIAHIVEQPTLEFKQGCLSLNPSDRMGNQNQFFAKIVCTICAIANTAEHGAIIIGVADTESDAKKIEELDKIQSRVVRTKKVVGVDREARALNKKGQPFEECLEQYIALWKNQILNSNLSEPLKTSVLSSFKYLPYHGLGLIVIDIPKQGECSFVGEQIYLRCVDGTSKIDSLVSAPKQIAGIIDKFKQSNS